MKKLMLTVLLGLFWPASTRAAVDSEVVGNMAAPRIESEVHHELLMLPHYTIFDNLAFRVDRSTVTLMGEVTRPVLKNDAERVVKKVEGVEEVKNEIRVLPLSPFDDGIRAETFRAIYGTPALNRYAHQAMPPIHIIVDNGRITLEGVVATEFDRNLAYMKAVGVHGAFSVTNHLKIDQQS